MVPLFVTRSPGLYLWSLSFWFSRSLLRSIFAIVVATDFVLFDFSPVRFEVHWHEHVSAKYQLGWRIPQCGVVCTSESVGCCRDEFCFEFASTIESNFAWSWVACYPYRVQESLFGFILVVDSIIVIACNLYLFPRIRRLQQSWSSKMGIGGGFVPLFRRHMWVGD